MKPSVRIPHRFFGGNPWAALYVPSLLALCLGSHLAAQADGASERLLVEPYDPPRADVTGLVGRAWFPKGDATWLLPTGEISEKQSRKTISLDGTWKISELVNSESPFLSDPEEEKRFADPKFDDGAWQDIPVPLDWYKQFPKSQRVDKPYVKGWYRKKISLPGDLKDKAVVLQFGVIGYEAHLFVDGKPVGNHHGDFTPWEVDLTDTLHGKGEFVLALRVLSDFGPSKGVKVHARHAYGSQWSIGNIRGGLWQPVQVVVEPRVRFRNIRISSVMDPPQVKVEAEVVSHLPSPARLPLHAGTSPAMGGRPAVRVPTVKVVEVNILPGDNTVSFVVPAKGLSPWSPDEPNLHLLGLALGNGEPGTAVAVTRFGHRQFEIKGNRFALNGRRIYLFGENMSSIKFGGNGDSRETIRKSALDYLSGLKSLGYNMVRNAHMPIHPEVLDVADELGMMIYNEWAWSFTKDLDPQVFERQNLAELKEWVDRDHNHASVVMWSCANEVFYGSGGLVQQNLDAQVRAMKAFDRQGRPVGTFSGSAFNYGDKPLVTDFLDLHSYIGLSFRPWSYVSDFFESIVQNIQSIYGDEAGKPLIIWESVGFSWGFTPDPKFKADHVPSYLDYAKKGSSWAAPKGIGFAGSIGLANALDPEKGGPYGMANIGRRVLNVFRLDERVSGFAPWFQRPDLSPATLWTQKIYASLGGDHGLPLRNTFGGRSVAQNMFLVNSTDDTQPGMTATFTLREKTGTDLPLGTLSVPPMKPWARLQLPVKLALPPVAAARWSQIRVTLRDERGSVRSQTYEDVFLQAPLLDAPLEIKKSLAVWFDKGEGFTGLTKRLQSWKVPFRVVTNEGGLAGVEALILPPSDIENPALAAGGTTAERILKWVEGGGNLLILEQNYRGEHPITGKTLKATPCVFADLVNRQHPAFRGLNRENFEFWNGATNGTTARFTLAPMDPTVLAAWGSTLGTVPFEVNGVLNDGAHGKGRILASQFLATSQAVSDSAACTLLRNLVQALGEGPVEASAPWSIVAKKNEFKISSLAALVPIDLKPSANMGFRDEVAGDGKGGWSDQGDNDFRMMPLGDLTLKKVPFKIIDPAGNNGKSCLVVKGGATGEITPKRPKIPVQQAVTRLFFLHTAAWVPRGNGPVVSYLVHYQDGKTKQIEATNGVAIRDWWEGGGGLPKAMAGLSMANPRGQEVGLTLMEWNNPRPEVPVEAVEMAAVGNAMAMLVGLTAETGKGQTVVVEDLAGGENGTWAALADAGGGKRLTEGPLVPTLERVRDGSWDALQVRWPQTQVGMAKPTVFRKFIQKIPNPDPGFKYLTMTLRAKTPGRFTVNLPKQDWKDKLLADVKLDPAAGWTVVRLSLADDFKLPGRSWTLSDLRGEVFITAFQGAAGSKAEAGAIDFAASTVKGAEDLGTDVCFQVREMHLE